jgi:FkbM family methyltransferase
MKLQNQLERYASAIKRKLNVDVEHRYKGFAIRLPSDHMLPFYQRHHRRYDRFLPHMAKSIGDAATIIDVGANCGDTLAGMVEQNPRARYICIEPDPRFFSYLTSNIERLRSAFPGIDVRAVKALVGKDVANAMLQGAGGTKHAVVGAGNEQSKPLGNILSELPPAPVRLLKSDVDGFDYDVIASAADVLIADHPLLFFECQHDTEAQKCAYERSISWLQSLGYVDWTVFDNYGEVMLRTNEVQHLFQLMEYVWRQNSRGATRTIYYYDILAAVSTDVDLIADVLRGY